MKFNRCGVRIQFKDASHKTVYYQNDEWGRYACQLLYNSLQTVQFAKPGFERLILSSIGLTQKMAVEHLNVIASDSIEQAHLFKPIHHLQLILETTHEKQPNSV